jgi:hypothetical protein
MTAASHRNTTLDELTVGQTARIERTRYMPSWLRSFDVRNPQRPLGRVDDGGSPRLTDCRSAHGLASSIPASSSISWDSGEWMP